MYSSFLPNVRGPSLSDIPHSQTILRAISVAFSRSSPAPVVSWFSTISSATLPPNRIVIWLMIINQITILLGGRVAEEIVLNQLTTGAGDDLEKATEMARKMVCEWGMSDKLGPLTFGKNEEHIFLGREVARQKDYSEDTALLIDGEIKRIVMDAASRAKQILQDNIEKLHALARALLERETLDGEEIARILRTRPFQEAASPA